jgi:hypothetical protein
MRCTSVGTFIHAATAEVAFHFAVSNWTAVMMGRARGLASLEFDVWPGAVPLRPIAIARSCLDATGCNEPCRKGQRLQTQQSSNRNSDLSLLEPEAQGTPQHALHCIDSACPVHLGQSFVASDSLQRRLRPLPSLLASQQRQPTHRSHQEPC